MILNPLPPDELMLPPLPVIRVKPGKPLCVLFLSEHWCGVDTHWFGGKTVCHSEPECKACDRNVAKIWKGFIPVCDAMAPDRRAILQITPRVVPGLLAAGRDDTGLLGLKAVFERIGILNNSPLRVVTYGVHQVPATYGPQRVFGIVQALFGEKIASKDG